MSLQGTDINLNRDELGHNKRQIQVITAALLHFPAAKYLSGTLTLISGVIVLLRWVGDVRASQMKSTNIILELSYL